MTDAFKLFRTNDRNFSEKNSAGFLPLLSTISYSGDADTSASFKLSNCHDRQRPKPQSVVNVIFNRFTIIIHNGTGSAGLIAANVAIATGPAVFCSQT